MMPDPQPVLFLSHGSPMTALGGDALSDAWIGMAAAMRRPAAILVVSAHWETQIPMVTGAAHLSTIHDFYGFPERLYTLRYPAPGSPELAQRIKALLTRQGFATGIDPTRGLDHGAWVPLRTLFPDADIPVLQLSLQAGRCARHHLALGAALAPLVHEGVLLVASGHMTHNLADYMRGGAEGPRAQTRAFRDWVHARLLGGDRDVLLDWHDLAPHAAFAHPTPEHFLPLFVALGAAGPAPRVDWHAGGYVGQSLAADNYWLTPAASEVLAHANI